MRKHRVIKEAPVTAAATDTSENFSEVTQLVMPEALPSLVGEQEAGELQVGHRVKAEAFGAGTVVMVGGDVVTVQFDNGEERKIKADYLKLATEAAAPEIKVDELNPPEPLNLQPTPEMLAYLEQESDAGIAVRVADLEKELMETLGQVSLFEARGLEYRIKAGRLLIKLKGFIEEHNGYGTWENRCTNSYKIDPRRARNYMRDAREADNPPDTSDNSSAANEPDAYEKVVRDLIAAEKREREEAAEANDKVVLRMTLGEVTPEERELFKAEFKRNPVRCQEILRRAFDEIINPPPVIRTGKKIGIHTDGELGIVDAGESVPSFVSLPASAPVVEA